MPTITSHELVIPAQRLAGFAGARVIADAHGSRDALAQSLAQAWEERLFVVQVGDLIDRGNHSAACASAMLALESAGRGLFVIGNHEWTLVSVVRGGSRSGESRQQTLTQFQAYGNGLLERFVARIEQGPLWVRFPRALIAHAAFHPGMLDLQAAHNPEAIARRALFGELSPAGSGKPKRTYRWVDTVPQGMTVVVGHDPIASGRVEVIEGRQGGRAIRLETGAWRDPARPLSYVDLSLAELGFSRAE